MGKFTDRQEGTGNNSESSEGDGASSRELVGEQATLLCRYKRSPDLKAFFSRDLKEFPSPAECT